jgi:hypothetical protein
MNDELKTTVTVSELTDEQREFARWAACRASEISAKFRAGDPDALDDFISMFHNGGARSDQ